MFFPAVENSEEIGTNSANQPQEKMAENSKVLVFWGTYKKINLKKVFVKLTMV